MKEKLQGVDPITNGEDHASGGDNTRSLLDPAQSKTPRTSGNIMHENRETWSASVAQSGGRPVGEGNSRTTHVYVSEESDSGAVPMNHSNKDGKPSAESEEGKPLVKENTHQSSTHSTQSEVRVSQGLAGVRKAAKERKGMKFTALLHHLTVGLLREGFYALKRKAAPGVDGITWAEYESGLEGRLTDLHSRVHRGAYRAQPSRRVYIP